jgi:hypothetical protein
LKNCTPTPRRRSHRLAVWILSLALAFGWCAGAARADGDPASDVLASQTLFLPQDAGVSAGQQAQLGALLRAAHHEGYQIRVALIASLADLGSVTALWRQPQNYARFLAQELSLLSHAPLLVIMPNGYGVYGVAPALAGMPAPGPNLASATLTAIRHIAAASGHRLPLPSATAPYAPASTDTVSWLVFAIGSALIVLAWTASLRARPLRARGARKPSS